MVHLESTQRRIPKFGSLKEESAEKYPPPLISNAVRIVAHVISILFWRIHYHGLENIPGRATGGFVIASNHQTYLDPVWICPPIKHRRFRFMAYDKAFEWRLVGPLIKYLGAFPVSGHLGESVDAIKDALASLREGAALVVFPEGQREFADGKMLPFKSGAVRIALEAGVPLLPVSIRGGNEVWPPDQKYPWLFRRVEIFYHPLLQIEDDRGLEPHENINRHTRLLARIVSDVEYLT